MAERETERVSNPFIGLQPIVFQRKKPLPPIKKTTTQPSRKPIRVVRTKKYHKIPAIETNKKPANSWPSTTDLSDDVMGTETMVTSSVNIQTSCTNNHIAFVDLQGKTRDLETFQTIDNTLMFDIDRDQTRKNYLMDKGENYHQIKGQKSKKQASKNGKMVDPVEHTGIPCKPRLHKLHSGKYCEWPV
ncbi:hypothetical protein AC249_AIPGENE20978 [Exaiptasia diaphana]|nr:hypothetical protein AC249_AIPGENE20978 [Exaiptasia diaphana]